VIAGQAIGVPVNEAGGVLRIGRFGWKDTDPNCPLRSDHIDRIRGMVTRARTA